MSKPSKGALRRADKRRTRSTQQEVIAFRRGMETGREVLGPEIAKRAWVAGAAFGFVLGVGAGVGLAQLPLSAWVQYMLS